MQDSLENFYPALVTDLAKTFAYDIVEAENDAKLNFVNLRTKLALHIYDLIRNDYNRLLTILYRIDVDETIVENCLGIQDIKKASEALADAVIERQIQKIRYRKAGTGS